MLHHLRFKPENSERLIRNIFATRSAFAIVGWVLAVLLSSLSGRIPFLGHMVDVEVRIWAASTVLIVEGLLFVPYYWARRRYPDREGLIDTLTATIDALMTTLYIYSIGGINFGVAAMFYALIIAFTGSVLSPAQTRYVIFLCILLYTGLSYLEWNGLLSAGTEPGPRMRSEYMSLFLFQGFGMLVFGVIGYLIGREYRGRERLMEVGSFVLGLSHELKPPLMAVLLGVTRLTPGTVVREEDVEGIRGSVLRLKKLVNSILDYGSIGDVPLHSVPASEVVELGVEMTRVALSENSSRVRIELETCPRGRAPVMADKEWLAQALANIMRNAAEAGRARGVVTVRLRVEDALWATIEVIDHGQGMSADTISRIFKPFFTTKGSGMGYGLGLPVARRIVEAHGGSVSVESEPGAGTFFTVRLPLADGLVG
ncbi:MAG: HAMP domain-containing sensor histidine kinase [bacterium]